MDNNNFFSSEALREMASRRAPGADGGLEHKILRQIAQHPDPKSAIAGVKLRGGIDFLEPGSCALFLAIENLLFLGHEISSENVENELGREGKLKVAGGPERIRTLFHDFDLELQSEDLLRQRVTRQRQIVFTFRLSRLLSEAQANVALDDPDFDAGRVGEEIVALQKECFPDLDKDFFAEDAIIGWYEDYDNPSGDNSFTTGYPELDRFMEDGRGWKKGRLIALLGGSGVGKTTVALNFARLANAAGKGVLIFSGEMSNQDLMTRMVCAEIGAQSWKVADRSLTNEQHQKVAQFVERFTSSPWLTCCDRPSDWSESYFDAKIRLFKSRYGRYPDIVFLDHFHKWVYMAGEIARGGYTSAPIEAQYMLSLGDLAKKYELAFVALVQPNKQAYGGGLDITSIKGSAAIAEEVDMVIAIDRPDLRDREAVPNMMSFSFSKNRYGPTGEVFLDYQPDCYKLG